MKRWSRSATIALANQRCVACWGLGHRLIHGDARPCRCVLRAIFRICHNKFRSCAESQSRPSVSTMPYNSRTTCTARRGQVHRVSGYKDREYIADFLLISKRTLGEDTLEYKIFKWHYLLGADFRAVNRKLKRRLDDRVTFHDFYRIEETLGCVFYEIEPFALFPIDEYFSTPLKQRAC